MCYGYKPVRKGNGRYLLHTEKDIRRMLKSGEIKESPDGFVFAKDTVEVILGVNKVRPMRWDLIPRGFLRDGKFTVAEVIQRKNSRAKNPDTGKTWGFSSYNARIETVDSLWTFKEAWRDCRRGIIPVEAFRERPNMDGAPEESKGREYEISLDQPYYLAALFDTWTSKDGESLDSCTVITGPSDDIPALQGIYHERTPILLSQEAAEAWLDPATTPRPRWRCCRLRRCR